MWKYSNNILFLREKFIFSHLMHTSLTRPLFEMERYSPPGQLLSSRPTGERRETPLLGTAVLKIVEMLQRTLLETL